MNLIPYQLYLTDKLFHLFPEKPHHWLPEVCRSPSNDILLLGSYASMPYLCGSYFPIPTRYIFRPDDAKAEQILSNRPLIIGLLRQQDIHLAVILESGNRNEALYVGTATAGAAVAHGPSSIALSFGLSRKLPWDVWLRVGGYSGWQIFLNEKDCYSIATHKEFEELKPKLDIDSLRVEAHRFEGDTLSFLAEGDCAFIMYHSTGSEEYVSARSGESLSRISPDPFVFFADSMPMEIPSENIIPRELAIQSLVSILFSGLPSIMKRVI